VAEQDLRVLRRERIVLQRQTREEVRLRKMMISQAAKQLEKK
jgi:hypothetical protein